MILPNETSKFNFDYKRYVILVFVLYVLIHLFLINFNAAEWGDSYRILRAAEIVKHTGAYPLDEKRQPLLSMFLALNRLNIEQVFFARLILFCFCLAAFKIYYLLVEKYISDPVLKIWAMLAFIFNNVYLYWSIRVMTDVPFSLFVLLAVYLYSIYIENKKTAHLLVLGLVSGLAIYTRFEGYMLTVCVSFALLAPKFRFDSRVLLQKVKEQLIFGISVLAVIGPYLFYRNPFNSSYFDEPGGRVYDWKLVAIFIASFVGVLGLNSWLAIIVDNGRILLGMLKNNLAITFYCLAELFLILVWPAAVPRLFVPIIPFFILFTAYVLQTAFVSGKQPSIKITLSMFALLAIYAVAQVFFKLQFLILDKTVFTLNLLSQIILVVLYSQRKKHYFLALSIICMVLWSYSILLMHRNILISIKEASVYTGKNIKGNVGYNDVSSVADWYLNYQYKNPNLKGKYYNMEKKKYLEPAPLKDANLDYLLITNEHNTSMTLDLEKRSYLKELKRFEYKVNGQVFVTRLVEIL